MFEKRDELLDAVDHACFQIIHMAKPYKQTPKVARELPRLLRGKDFEVAKIKSSGE